MEDFYLQCAQQPIHLILRLLRKIPMLLMKSSRFPTSAPLPSAPSSTPSAGFRDFVGWPGEGVGRLPSRLLFVGDNGGVSGSIVSAGPLVLPSAASATSGALPRCFAATCMPWNIKFTEPRYLSALNSVNLTVTPNPTLTLILHPNPNPNPNLKPNPNPNPPYHPNPNLRKSGTAYSLAQAVVPHYIRRETSTTAAAAGLRSRRQKRTRLFWSESGTGESRPDVAVATGIWAMCSTMGQGRRANAIA